MHVKEPDFFPPAIRHLTRIVVPPEGLEVRPLAEEARVDFRDCLRSCTVVSVIVSLTSVVPPESGALADVAFPQPHQELEWIQGEPPH